ncbi:MULTISPECIES: hybrid sensor histidine kinase/response regulator [unclassified Sphingomonas]|uniref:hybrid sensor histidine kinase/response regulator n=1 Tax=Novosphingobium rhizosphaerae TaxID=1551649 RepID=UPI0015C973A4
MTTSLSSRAPSLTASELDDVRRRFGRFLVFLLWAHVPLLALVGGLNGRSPLAAAGAGALLALAYHLMWWRNGIAPATRYLSAVALVGEPALLLFLLQGHPWQMDMHMYFFAMLALTIAWCDRGAILMAAGATVLHHLVLLYALPYAVFPGEGNLVRVLIHAVIVAFQTAVLVWLSAHLVEAVQRITAMGEDIRAKNLALEERTREAEHATRAKAMFLANMSHEIRTPMNAILGFCHLAQRTALDARQQVYVTRIADAGASLLRLINDILDYSKNEAGKLTLEARPFEVRACVENQVQMLAVDAQAKGVALRVTIAPRVPQMVVGDELRFGQVLLNLLSNAVKFTEKGVVMVAMDLVATGEGTVTLECSVRDTGIGMTAQHREALFSSFTQVDSSMTRRFGGSGLGLAISRQIVEQMGGGITVESTPGLGSVFTFRVVLGDAGSLARAGLIMPRGLAGLRILAADDNAASRDILRALFNSWGMTIDLAASGDEALAAIEAAAVAGRPFDLVLLDWKMPRLSGMDTIKAMRNRVPRENLPVTLLVTAYGNDEFLSEVERADVDAFLTKPVQPRALIETICHLFPERVDRAPDAVAPTPPASAETVRLAPRFQGARVLLVEDNAINREIAMELLDDAGLDVDCAENGRIACAMVAAQSGAYAAVLMDVQMPEMDGIEATTRIRRTWGADVLPIIAMTAHAYEDERQRCLAAGMNDHITKPVDPALLVRTLEQWLQVPGADGAAKPWHAPVANGAAASDAIPLPDHLPPFGIPAALARVNGKRALLAKLIGDFADIYAATPGALASLVDEGRLAEARRLAHSLKGVAASLELPQVTAVAGRIERLLAAEQTFGLDREIALLGRELEPAIEAARSLTPPIAPGTLPSPTPANSAFDLAAQAQAREGLVDLVQRRSLAARAAFVVYAEALGLPEAAREAHPVRQALARLDYGRALALLEAERGPHHAVAGTGAPTPGGQGAVA